MDQGREARSPGLRGVVIDTGLASTTHELGPLYASLTHYPKGTPAPVLERGWTNTTEPPWLYGQCLVLRMWPLRWAVSLGVWREHRVGITPLQRISDDPSDRQLIGALDGHALPDEDVAGWDC